MVRTHLVFAVSWVAAALAAQELPRESDPPAQRVTSVRERFSRQFGAPLDVENGADFKETDGYHKLLKYLVDRAPGTAPQQVPFLDWKIALDEPERLQGEVVRVRGRALVRKTRLDTPVTPAHLDVWRVFLMEQDGSNRVVVDLIDRPTPFVEDRDRVEVEGVFYRLVKFEPAAKPGSFVTIPYLVGRTLRLAAAPMEQDWTAYDQDVDRKLTRVAYLGSEGYPGQYTIDYGTVTWKTEYEVAVEALRGKRTQLGKGFWPRLDTNLNLSIGGTKVAEGNYYLGIGRAIDGAWKLVLFSPGAIRRAKGDAATTSMITSPAIEAPLSYERVGQPVQELRIELKVLPEQVGHAMLSLQWGNHQLTASVVAELPLPGAKAVDRTKTGDGEAGVEKGELAPGSPPRGRGRSGK